MRSLLSSKHQGFVPPHAKRATHRPRQTLRTRLLGSTPTKAVSTHSTHPYPCRRLPSSQQRPRLGAPFGALSPRSVSARDRPDGRRDERAEPPTASAILAEADVGDSLPFTVVSTTTITTTAANTATAASVERLVEKLRSDPTPVVHACVGWSCACVSVCVCLDVFGVRTFL